jgi:SIR2-like domain
MARDKVIPFLGAGVNFFDRPPGAAWQRGAYLPKADELARHLAERFGYPRDEPLDLMRVSEYAYVMNGSWPLYAELHRVFDADYPAGRLHRFLAGLPRRLEQAGQPRRCQLIVTTNYDDALERAFREANEPFDLVCYIAEGDQSGKFAHWAPEGAHRVIDIPNEYAELTSDKRSVILKIHGAVDRAGPEADWDDSYVITEDDYIDYLIRTKIGDAMPVKLTKEMLRSHFLFLGYGMRDWNLRVLLHRVWGGQKLKCNSWAIQRNPGKLEREFWRRRGVDVYDVPLEEYVPALEAALEAELAELQRVPAGS